MEIKTTNIDNNLDNSVNDSLIDDAECKARTISIMSTENKSNFFLGNSIHEKYPYKFGKIKVLFYLTDNIFVTIGPDCKFL